MGVNQSGLESQVVVLKFDAKCQPEEWVPAISLVVTDHLIVCEPINREPKGILDRP